MRAVSRTVAEKTCCSCTPHTWSRRLAATRLKGFAVGVVATLSSTVYALESASLEEGLKSNRVVPKSWRMVWSGWLKASAIPPPSLGPFSSGHSVSNDATPGARPIKAPPSLPVRASLSGTSVTALS